MDIIGYGVCRLSLVAVRKDPADAAEQVTQLLFGDHYEVIDESPEGKWLKICIYFDQYIGWIDSKQHHAISKESFEYFNYAEFKISTDTTSSLLYNKMPLIVLLGSIIPISGAELFKMEEQFAFNGESKSLGQRRDVDFIKAIAKKYLNTPYLWGGKSPFGIDCSGFTQMVYKLAGYKLLRDSSQQAGQGKLINLSSAQPGDLAFFKNDKDKIIHTGIVLDAEKIIHASGRVRIDTLTTEGIFNNELQRLTHRIAHIRRILPD